MPSGTKQGSEPTKEAKKGSRRRAAGRSIAVTIIGGLLTFAGESYVTGDVMPAVGALVLSVLVLGGYHLAEEGSRLSQYNELLDAIGLDTFKVLAEASDEACKALGEMDPEDVEKLLNGSDGEN